MSWGLLKGFGQGLASSGQLLFNAALQEEKQRWQEEYRQRVTQEERAFQKEQTAEDREYKKGLLEQEREYQKGQEEASVSYRTEGDKTVKVTTFADGRELTEEVLSRKATGELTDREKETLDAIDTDLRALRNDTLGENTAEIAALAQERNRILGIETPQGSTAPDYDAALSRARERAEAWADQQAGWLSSDKSDFKEWGGNREQAIAEKTQEFLRMEMGEPGRASPAMDGMPDSAMDDMPDPSQHNGRMIRDEDTGDLYRSNGTKWIKVG